MIQEVVGSREAVETSLDTYEQSIGGTEITYGDVYRIGIAANAKKFRLEQNGLGGIDSQLIEAMEDYMPLDQDVKDGGTSAIMHAREEAIKKLKNVFEDPEQLDLLICAIEPESPLDEFMNYVYGQTDSPQKANDFYDIITDTRSAYGARSIRGSVEIQKAEPLEPAKLHQESPRPENVEGIEKEVFTEDDFLKEVKALVDAERARRAGSNSTNEIPKDVQPKNPKNKNSKSNKKSHEASRETYLNSLRQQIIDVADSVKGPMASDLLAKIEESRIIKNIDELPFVVRDLALARQANLLSCRENESFREYTLQDLAIVVAHKQSEKMPFFAISGKNTRGKKMVMGIIEETVQAKIAESKNAKKHSGI